MPDAKALQRDINIIRWQRNEGGAGSSARRMTDG